MLDSQLPKCITFDQTLAFWPSVPISFGTPKKASKKGVTVNPETETATEDEISVDVLIEDVSIDGMCGVY